MSASVATPVDMRATRSATSASVERAGRQACFPLLAACADRRTGRRTGGGTDHRALRVVADHLTEDRAGDRAADDLLLVGVRIAARRPSSCSSGASGVTSRVDVEYVLSFTTTIARGTRSARSRPFSPGVDGRHLEHDRRARRESPRRSSRSPTRSASRRSCRRAGSSVQTFDPFVSANVEPAPISPRAGAGVGAGIGAGAGAGITGGGCDRRRSRVRLLRRLLGLRASRRVRANRRGPILALLGGSPEPARARSPCPASVGAADVWAFGEREVARERRIRRGTRVDSHRMLPRQRDADDGQRERRARSCRRAWISSGASSRGRTIRPMDERSYPEVSGAGCACAERGDALERAGSAAQRASGAVNRIVRRSHRARRAPAQLTSSPVLSGAVPQRQVDGERAPLAVGALHRPPSRRGARGACA